MTPVTVDPAHPFPRVINKALCLAFLLQRKRGDSRIHLGRGHRAARASSSLSHSLGGGHHRIHFPARHRRRVCRAPLPRLQNSFVRALSRHPQQQSVPARRRIAQHSRFGRFAAPSPPQRRSRAPGDRSRRRPRNHRTAAFEFPPRGVAGVSSRRARQSVAPLQSLRPNAAPRSEIHAFRAERACRSARSAGAFQSAPRARRPAASSLRFLFHGGALHRKRRARSRRAFHQADSLSHQRRFAHRARADGSGLQKGSHRRRRAESALRRSLQHSLGAQPSGSGRAGLSRSGRTEDALQTRLARAPRSRRQSSPLRAPRHRQLQSFHGALLHGLKPAYLRPANHRSRPLRFQFPYRLFRAGQLRPAVRGAAESRQELRQPDRPRSRPRQSRTARL